MGCANGIPVADWCRNGLYVACCWKYCVEGESLDGLNMVVCADSIDSKKSVKEVGAREAGGAAVERELEEGGTVMADGVGAVLGFVGAERVDVEQ